jgi:flagellar protein FlaG
MQDVTTLSSQNSRALATDVNRRDAKTVTVDPVHVPGSANARSSAGKNVPASVDPAQATRDEQEAAASRHNVDNAIAKLNDYVQSIQRDLEFSLDEGTGQAIVQVIDRTTQQVVRQIPSDVALRLARNLNVQQQYASDARGASDDASALELINTRI